MLGLFIDEAARFQLHRAQIHSSGDTKAGRLEFPWRREVFRLDFQPPIGRTDLERFHKDKRAPGDAYVQFLLSVGPDLKKGWIPFGVTGNEPNGVISSGYRDLEGVFACAFD